MSRWIDADAFIDDLYEHEFSNWCDKDEVSTLVNDAPSIDIVRCKECKHASDNKVYGCMLNHFNDNDYDYHRMYADDFCSHGERKESE